MSKIKEVKINSGCIACGTCSAVCSEVFQVNSISQVKQDVQLQDYKDCIQEAADMCPVNVIEVVYDND